MQAKVETLPLVSEKLATTVSGVQGSGAAIFNPNATGKLSFLSNKVVIIIHNGNRDGTNMIKAWEWK